MTERVLEVDWYTVTLLSMLFFAILSGRNGWQRGLVTLVSLFFAWGVALETTNFIVRALEFVFEIDVPEDATGLVRILLYIASAIMVIVTFNSRVIPTRTVTRRDSIAGISTGLLSGYFFVLLLLDLGRDWLAINLPDARTLVYSSNISIDSSFRQTVVVVQFLNNPIVVYDRLSEVQNLVILFLLLVFFHGLLFWLLGRVDRTLRSPV